MDAKQLGSELQTLSGSAKTLSEILDLLLCVPDSAGEVIRINADSRATGGAIKIRAGFEFSDRFGDAVAALRTIEPDLVLIKDALHDSLKSPKVEVSPADTPCPGLP